MLSGAKTIFVGLGLLALVLYGCNANDTNFGGDEPKSEWPQVAFPGTLTNAVLSNDLPAVESALKAGADVNERIGEKDRQFTPLLAAVVMGHEQIAEVLIKNGAAVFPTYQGYNAKDYSYELYPESSKLIFLLESASTRGR